MEDLTPESVASDAAAPVGAEAPRVPSPVEQGAAAVPETGLDVPAPASQANTASKQEKASKDDKGNKTADADSNKPAKAKVSALTKAAQTYVSELLTRELSPKLTYHALAHTEAVVKECRALAPAAQLSDDDTEALLVAAWFHDTGYLDVYDGHEFSSMERAAAWLPAQGVPADRVQLIEALIKATHRDTTSET